LWQPGAAAVSLNAKWACRRNKRSGTGRRAEENMALAAIHGDARGSLPRDILCEFFVGHDISTMTGAATK
jgi:hypothetical protein